MCDPISLRRLILLTAAAIPMLCAEDAGAQTARSGGAPNAQLMQQMQQLASERTTLQAENAKLKKDLEDLRKERDTLKNGQVSVDRRAQTAEASLRQSTAQRESVERDLTQAKEKMSQLVDKFKETLQTLRTVEADDTNTKRTLATREQALNVCIDRNMALYKIDEEVLDVLEHQTFWKRASQIEPFTRIKRTQLENLVDEYKSRASEQRLPSSGVPNMNPAGPRSTEVQTPPIAGMPPTGSADSASPPAAQSQSASTPRPR